MILLKRPSLGFKKLMVQSKYKIIITKVSQWMDMKPFKFGD